MSSTIVYVLDPDSLTDALADFAQTPDEGYVLHITGVDWSGVPFVAWMETHPDNTDFGELHIDVPTFTRYDGAGVLHPHLEAAKVLSWPVAVLAPVTEGEVG